MPELIEFEKDFLWRKKQCPARA